MRNNVSGDNRKPAQKKVSKEATKPQPSNDKASSASKKDSVSRGSVGTAEGY